MIIKEEMSYNMNENLNNEEKILLCIEWLELQGTTKTINTRHSSHGYRNIIEEWAEAYVSEDAFIEAVKILQIPYKRVPFNTHSIHVALSEKTVRQYKDRRSWNKRSVTTHIPALKRGENK